MTDKFNRVLYTGMSTMLPERIQSHKDKLVEGFTKKYNCTKLVYYRIVDDRDNALMLEKQIKGWNRSKKASVVKMDNPDWKDLFEELIKLAA